MKHANFVRKYNGYSIEDYHLGTSPEFQSFCRDFKVMLDTEFPFCDVKVYSGNYSVSGVISKDNKHICVNYLVPSHGRPMDFSRRDELGGVLYCAVKSTSDFTGGQNRYVAMKSLPDCIRKLLG